MPKRTRSVFKPRKIYKAKTKQVKQQKQAAKRRPGEAVYSALNQITGILTQINGLIYGVMDQAPNLMKDYARRSAMELHALQKLLTDKLPDNYSKEDDEVVHDYSDDNTDNTPSAESTSSIMEDFEALEKSIAVAKVDPKSKELCFALTSYGLSQAIVALQEGTSKKAIAFLSLHNNNLKAACEAMLAYWEVEVVNIINNHKHDPEEQSEMKEAFQQDLANARNLIKHIK